LGFQIPQFEPNAFVSGDTVLWTKVLATYPLSDGWTLNYRLVGDTQSIDTAKITVAADTGLGGWDVTITATNSAGLAPGVYRLIGWVLLPATGERHIVFDDTLQVLADVTTGTPASLQSPNKQILIAIDARLSGRITADQEQVHINGTSIMRIPIEKLMAIRGIYAAKVWREQNAGQAFPSVATRMTKPQPIDADDNDSFWSVP